MVKRKKQHAKDAKETNKKSNDFPEEIGKYSWLLEIASSECFKTTQFNKQFSENDIKVKIQNSLKEFAKKETIDTRKKKIESNIKEMTNSAMAYYNFYSCHINNINSILQTKPKEYSGLELDKIIEKYLSSIEDACVTEDKKTYIRAYARHFFEHQLEVIYTNIALEALSEIYIYDIDQHLWGEYLKKKCTEFNFEKVEERFKFCVYHIISILKTKIDEDLDDINKNVKKMQIYLELEKNDFNDNTKTKIRNATIRFYLQNQKNTKIVEGYYNEIIPKILDDDSSKEQYTSLIQKHLKDQNIDPLHHNTICNIIHDGLFRTLLYEIAKDIGNYTLNQIKNIEKGKNLIKKYIYPKEFLENEDDLKIPEQNSKDDLKILKQIKETVKIKIAEKNRGYRITNNKQKTQEELEKDLRSNLETLDIKEKDWDFGLDELMIDDYILDLITFNIQGINKGIKNEFGFTFGIENDKIRRLFDIKEAEDIKKNEDVKCLANLAYASIFLTYFNKDLLLFAKILETNNIQGIQNLKDIDEQLNKLEKSLSTDLKIDNINALQKEILLQLNDKPITVIDQKYHDFIKTLQNKISDIKNKNITIIQPNTTTTQLTLKQRQTDDVLYYRYT